MLVPNTPTPPPTIKWYVRVLKELSQYVVAFGIVLLLYFAVFTMSLGMSELLDRFFGNGA